VRDTRVPMVVRKAACAGRQQSLETVEKRDIRFSRETAPSETQRLSDSEVACDELLTPLWAGQALDKPRDQREAEHPDQEHDAPREPRPRR
jgi:hypothetical protein